MGLGVMVKIDPVPDGLMLAVGVPEPVLLADTIKESEGEGDPEAVAVTDALDEADTPALKAGVLLPVGVVLIVIGAVADITWLGVLVRVTLPPPGVVIVIVQVPEALGVGLAPSVPVCDRVCVAFPPETIVLGIVGKGCGLVK